MGVRSFHSARGALGSPGSLYREPGKRFQGPSPRRLRAWPGRPLRPPWGWSWTALEVELECLERGRERREEERKRFFCLSVAAVFLSFNLDLFFLSRACSSSLPRRLPPSPSFDHLSIFASSPTPLSNFDSSVRSPLFSSFKKKLKNSTSFSFLLFSFLPLLLSFLSPKKSWCDEMLASADVDFWIQNNVLTYLCVDTGATGRFGTPTGESDPRLFGNYLAALDEAAAAVTFGSSSSSSMSPKKKGSSLSTRLALSGASSSSSSSSAAAAESKEEEKELKTSSTDAFTLVLVDGRFRVACALKALWHLDHARGVLLVHDWLARSAQYHDPILKRYTLLAVVDRLAVLAPSSPPSPTSTMEGESSGDENDDDEAAEEARVRWWREAAEEMDKYSRDAA